MNISDEISSFFDNLDEYVYLPAKAATYLTDKDINELEQFDKKKHKKLEENWILIFWW